jgi:hypothetical protein
MFSNKNIKKILKSGGQGLDIKPAVTGIKPAVTGLEPAVTGLEPVVMGLEPAVTGLEPAVTGLEPAVTGLEPAVTGLEPAVTGLEPAVTGIKPAVTGLEPAVTGLEPAVTGLEPTKQSEIQYTQSPGVILSETKYPNTDYLYDNITSLKINGDIKINICAYTINTELNTHFVKYIVQKKDKNVILPVIQVSTNPQIIPVLEPPMTGQPIPGQPIPGQPITGEPIPRQPITGEPITGQPMNGQPMPGQPMPGQPMPGQPMTGGYLDSSSTDEDLDKKIKSQIIEFVKTMYKNTTDPKNIGIIPNVSGQGSVFAFVKIDDAQNKYFSKIENSEYIESTLNELFHLHKVFDFNVDETIKQLFTNNQWLYMQQSLASPFTGYLCKLDGNEIKNVTDGGDPSSFLINIDDIGDFFYFSFLPLDPQNASLCKRYVLLPMEYECILENAELVHYKQNRISYENINSIYFKGEILSNRKEGHQFFAIKSPTQFTDI